MHARVLNVRRNLERTDRPLNIFQRLLADVGGVERDLVVDVRENVLGRADAARVGNALEPRGDVHGIAHQIAGVTHHHIANRETDAKDNSPLRGHRRIARIVGTLNSDSAARCIDRAGKFRQDGVAGGVEDPPLMLRDEAGELGRDLAKAAHGIFFVLTD